MLKLMSCGIPRLLCLAYAGLYCGLSLLVPANIALAQPSIPTVRGTAHIRYDVQGIDHAWPNKLINSRLADLRRLGTFSDTQEYVRMETENVTSRTKDSVERKVADCWVMDGRFMYALAGPSGPGMLVAFNGRKYTHTDPEAIGLVARKDSGNSGSRLLHTLTVQPGNRRLAEDWIPYLGFRQPGHFPPINLTVGDPVQTPNGYEQRIDMSSYLKGHRPMEMRLLYDSAGRLIRMEKRGGRELMGRWTFTDFRELPNGFTYPQTVRGERFFSYEGKPVRDRTETYKATAVDTARIDASVFDANRPLPGTSVGDARYQKESQPLIYTYVNTRYTVDEMSDLRSRGLTEKEEGPSVIALGIRWLCYSLVLFAFGRAVVGLYRSKRAQGDVSK